MSPFIFIELSRFVFYILKKHGPVYAGGVLIRLSFQSKKKVTWTLKLYWLDMVVVYRIFSAVDYYKKKLFPLFFFVSPSRRWLVAQSSNRFSHPASGRETMKRSKWRDGSNSKKKECVDVENKDVCALSSKEIDRYNQAWKSDTPLCITEYIWRWRFPFYPHHLLLLRVVRVYPSCLLSPNRIKVHPKKRGEISPHQSTACCGIISPSIHSMKKGDRKGRDIQAYEIHAPRHIGKIKGRRNSTQKEKIDLYSTRRFLAVAFKNKKTLLNNAPRFFPTFSEKFSAHLFFIYNATWKNSIHYE